VTPLGSSSLRLAAATLSAESSGAGCHEHGARRSLYYRATYLLGTGFALLLVPRLAFKLFFSSGEYGDVMPRMAGAVIATLGMLVVQVIRHRVDVLYPTLVGARVFLCAAWLGLLVYSHDVFFGIVFIVVAAGMVWTAIAYTIDKRAVRDAR
jgi:hypothetical protein